MRRAVVAFVVAFTHAWLCVMQCAPVAAELRFASFSQVKFASPLSGIAESPELPATINSLRFQITVELAGLGKFNETPPPVSNDVPVMLPTDDRRLALG